MDNRFERARYLSAEKKLAILHQAKELCNRWYIDKLDCSVSWCRELCEMDWATVISKFDDSCLFSIIHRDQQTNPHLEIGFSTMGKQPIYYLWIELNEDLIPLFLEHIND